MEHNLRLVAHIVKKYYTQVGGDTDDLISIGTVGLIKAVNTYRLDRKIRLATYAARCIEKPSLSPKRHTGEKKKRLSDRCLTAFLFLCCLDDGIQQGAFLLHRTVQVPDGVKDEISVDISDSLRQFTLSGIAGRIMYNHIDRSVFPDGPHLLLCLLYDRASTISTQKRSRHGKAEDAAPEGISAFSPGAIYSTGEAPPPL